MTANKELQKTELSMSARFMNHVVQEYGSGVGEVALTNFQKRLAQNYFMAVDDALAKQEQKRDQQKENVPSTWQNVNMERLARDVVACARIGLDPMENNHISPVLYKNNRTGKYDVGFIPRYKGIELKAKKYGLDCPDAVIVELVYQNDRFKMFKKSAENNCDRYEFDIENPFDRGEIIGGFYYHVYSKFPEKNLLVVMSKADIDKRKPKYASPEFWGGEKAVWDKGKKVGTEKTDGWYEKMAFKTVYRAAYSAITIDSQKIDDDYRRLSAAEDLASSRTFDDEYTEKANSTMLPSGDEPIDAEFSEESVDHETGEVVGRGDDKPPFQVG